MGTASDSVVCASCRLAKDTLVLVLVRVAINVPFSPENKHRFLCEECRNLMSTRGWWKYVNKIASKSKVELKPYDCNLCGHMHTKDFECQIVW